MPSANRIRGRLAYGGVLLVPVQLQGHDIECLVDTGAAYTALSADLVTLLGFASIPQRTAHIVKAQGAPRTVPVVTLSSVRLGGVFVPEVEAIVLDFPSIVRLDGIVGMNILRHFRMTLESDTATLILRPRRSGST